MALIPIPVPIVVYTQPLINIPSFWRNAPQEGDQSVPGSIDWGADSGSARSMLINVQDISNRGFKQIRALYVNNLNCGVDIQLVFPDTGQEVTIEANSQGLYQVETRQLAFHIFATGAQSGDKTFFVVYNSLPPPVAITRSQLASTVSSGGITMTADSTTALVAAGINGTLLGVVISFAGVKAGVGDVIENISIQDGNANTLLFEQMGAFNGTNMAQVAPLVFTGMFIRYANGINLVLTHSGTLLAAGNVAVSLYHRTP